MAGLYNIVHNHIYDAIKHIKHKRRTLHVEKGRCNNIDDRVLVDRRSLQVKAENMQSLTHKWLGSFKVTKGIGSHAY